MRHDEEDHRPEDRDAPVIFDAEIVYQDSKGKSHRYSLVFGDTNVQTWIAHADLMEGSLLNATSRKHSRGRIIIPFWLAKTKGLV